MSYEKLVSDHTPEYEKEWGRYNDSLPNLQEITAEDLLKAVSSPGVSMELNTARSPLRTSTKGRFSVL